MLEIHPFGNFVPKVSKYLMLGSFVTKPTHPYEWFYANGRNQFWPIMEEVYGVELKTKAQQQEVFEMLEMALADIIYSCERLKNSNLDINLTNLVFNIAPIVEIIQKYKIKKVFFTSRYVENIFMRQFKDKLELTELELVCLPSPSPRYAMLTKSEKVEKYKLLLPNILTKHK